MKFMSLYAERHSVVHRIDPITKLIYAAAAIVIPFILPSFYIAGTCLLISLILLWIGRVLSRALPLFAFVLFVLATVMIIQGLFYPGNKEIALQLWILDFYKEGLRFGLGISLRALNIVSAFSILVLTTKPSDLVDALVRKGLSPRFGYVLNSVFQIVPQMIATVGTITDAQRSRGLETEGRLLVRIKALIPLLGPVVISSLIQAKERALALQVRGFNATGIRTFLNEPQVYPHQSVLRWGLIGLIIAAILWRIFI